MQVEQRFMATPERAGCSGSGNRCSSGRWSERKWRDPSAGERYDLRTSLSRSSAGSPPSALDKPQSSHGLTWKEPIPCWRTRRLLQKPFPFVISNRFQIDAAQPRGITLTHTTILRCLMLSPKLSAEVLDNPGIAVRTDFAPCQVAAVGSGRWTFDPHSGFAQHLRVAVQADSQKRVAARRGLGNEKLTPIGRPTYRAQVGPSIDGHVCGRATIERQNVQQAPMGICLPEGDPLAIGREVPEKICSRIKVYSCQLTFAPRSGSKAEKIR